MGLQRAEHIYFVHFNLILISEENRLQNSFEYASGYHYVRTSPWMMLKQKKNTAQNWSGPNQKLENINI